MPGPSGIGHRADVGLRKVAAHKEERFSFGLSQGVGGTVAEIEFGRVAAAAI